MPEEESEEEEDNQRAAKQRKMDSLQLQMKKMLDGMEELKKNVATKEDIRGVNGRLRVIESEQKSFDDRLKRIERDKANGSNGPTNGPRPRPLNIDRSMDEAANYRKARRSLYISPVDPDLENVRNYLKKELGIPDKAVDDMKLEDIRPIHPKKMPAHRKDSAVANKTHISVRDSYERDLVVSYTTNLKPPARLDIVVPEHLLSLKAKLEGLAYKLRKHAKDTSDKKIMTSLRLDDKTESLTMAVRESREDPWLHYSFQELKQLESKICRGPPAEEDEDEFV